MKEALIEMSYMSSVEVHSLQVTEWRFEEVRLRSKVFKIGKDNGLSDLVCLISDLFIHLKKKMT